MCKENTLKIKSRVEVLDQLICTFLFFGLPNLFLYCTPYEIGGSVQNLASKRLNLADRFLNTVSWNQYQVFTGILRLLDVL